MVTQTKNPPLTASNPWWGHNPSDKQLVALWGYEKCPDLFYGGAAGPGKTSYLLMAAVQYAHYSHYRALDTPQDLRRPEPSRRHHGPCYRLVGWSGWRQI